VWQAILLAGGLSDRRFPWRETSRPRPKEGGTPVSIAARDQGISGSGVSGVLLGLDSAIAAEPSIKKAVKRLLSVTILSTDKSLDRMSFS
jgi:hypothetical protein